MNIPHWAEMGISKIFEKEAQRRFGDYQGGDNTKNEGKPTSILTGQFQCVCQCSTLFFYLSAVFTALKLKSFELMKASLEFADDSAIASRLTKICVPNLVLARIQQLAASLFLQSMVNFSNNICLQYYSILSIHFVKSY